MDANLTATFQRSASSRAGHPAPDVVVTGMAEFRGADQHPNPVPEVVGEHPGHFGEAPG